MKTKLIISNVVRTSIVLGLAISFSIQVFGTGQEPDILIYKRKSIQIDATLLYQFPNFDSLRAKVFGERKVVKSTSCLDGYIAEWKIINKQLYLTGIISCYRYNTDKIQANLKDLFGANYRNGKVKADWVTENITIPQGKCYGYLGLVESLYERELELRFENGKLKGKKYYYNSKSKRSTSTQDYNKFTEYIYRNLNWNVFSIQDSTVEILIAFSANENGIIDDVNVLGGYSGESYREEAIRVIKSIPEMAVHYRREEFVRIYWLFQIVFSEENRLKYKK